jgi:hypothetical protein
LLPLNTLISSVKEFNNWRKCHAGCPNSTVAILLSIVVPSDPFRLVLPFLEFYVKLKLMGTYIFQKNWLF